MPDSALESTPGGAALEAARTLLRKGQTLAAIPLIEEALPLYPKEAGELMAEAQAQIQTIQEVMERAIEGDWSKSNYALDLAKRAATAFAQIIAQIRGKS